MKRFKVLAFAVLTLAVLGAAFAFSTPKKANFADRYFRLKASASYTLTALQTPSNWEEISISEADHQPGFVHEIRVISNQSTYIYSSNLPKVDASPLSSQLSSAFNSGGTPIEITGPTDYKIYVNTDR